jgi:uncharacterized protein (DUF2062 family)
MKRCRQRIEDLFGSETFSLAASEPLSLPFCLSPTWRAGTFILQDYSTLLFIKLAQTLLVAEFGLIKRRKIETPIIFL